MIDQDEGVCACCRRRLPVLELVAWRFWWGTPALPARGLLCADCEDELGLVGDLIEEDRAAVADS